MFLILRGPAGAGKTAVAQRLAQVLGAVRIGVDEALAERGLDKVVGGSIPLASFLEADKLVVLKARATLKEGKVVIIDGCFYHPEHLSHLLARMPGPRLVFSLQASLQACTRRNRERSKPLSDDAVRAVYTLARKAEKGIIINAEGSLDEVTDKVLSEYLARQRKRR